MTFFFSRLSFSFSLAVPGFVLLFTGLRAAQESQHVNQVSFSSSVTVSEKRPSSLVTTPKDYSYRFGAGLVSAPSNVKVEGGGFLAARDFPTAAYCGHCHQETQHQWRESLHSNSFRTPFYQKSVSILEKTKGIEFTRHCEGCHDPIAVVSGSLDPKAVAPRNFDDDGVTCMVCHSIVKTDPKLGNGSYMLTTPSVMVDIDGKRIPGEVSDAEILAHPDRHSKAVMQDIYRTPEFCASCHKASVPVALNDYRPIDIFSAYDEWQQSQFSQSNPLVFYPSSYRSCQSCHMPLGQISLPDPGATRGMLFSHRWPAGNTAVPFYSGADEQLKKTIEFLKRGNYLDVDIFGLKLGAGTEVIAPLGSVPVAVKPNDVWTVYVVIQNKGIGHSLLPEIRDLYEAWMKFTATDATGKQIYQSGFLRPDGTLDPSAHAFINVPVNVSGGLADDHTIWTIRSEGLDTTVQAGRSTLVRYSFKIPKNAVGPITLRAAVDYRHFRQSYLDHVLGPRHTLYPVIELAGTERQLVFDNNALSRPLPGAEPDWMRWNNVGIGYLDELQNEMALHAFKQVTRLRPDYADGYVNVGLALIELGKPRDAKSILEEALTLHPGYARALYYRARVERALQMPEAAIEDLKEMVRQYPHSRDGLRELAVAYQQNNKITEAVAQFKALQSIDPENLDAHLNLSILYRRLGLQKEARYEEARYASLKPDPGAPTYSLDFLRKHPQIATESAAWHVHSGVQ